MQGTTMSLNTFDILMVIAVGSMTGAGIGLIIGYIAKKQGTVTSIMTRNDMILNCALIAGCSCMSIVGLSWIFLR
jgi:hypothetical protein